MKAPKLDVFITLEAVDRHGKRTAFLHRRSHSITRNYYNLLTAHLCALCCTDGVWGDGHLNIKQISGAVASDTTHIIGHSSITYPEGAGNGMRGEANTAVGAGIKVGSGATAESFEDYKLDTLIEHGVGADQLSYQEGNAPAEEWQAGPRIYQTQYIRYFNNNSGGVVTVREIGIQYLTYEPNSAVGMMARDVLGASIDVADAGQLKVTYTFQVTFPS